MAKHLLYNAENMTGGGRRIWQYQANNEPRSSVWQKVKAVWDGLTDEERRNFVVWESDSVNFYTDSMSGRLTHTSVQASVFYVYYVDLNTAQQVRHRVNSSGFTVQDQSSETTSQLFIAYI